MIEIETVDAFEEAIEQGIELRGAVFQSIDLSAHQAELLTSQLRGAVFLGCVLTPASLQHATNEGALVFPDLPSLPFQPYRARLYDQEELYRGFDRARPESYEQTVDGRVYQHYVDSGRDEPTSLLETLARRLHDHAITDALEELLRGRKVVALMGGHSMSRGDDSYRKVVQIARTLTQRGFFIASGGGPGAMEAAHLGAYLVARSDDDVEHALDILSEAPTFTHPLWLARAFDVLVELPLTPEASRISKSVGIPTWAYGHEPPNPFASHIAKYFANSVREAGLLTIARHGVVFSPGSAGTIQEVFQDACQNHYTTAGVVSPMIFLGEAFWTVERPVFPLLCQLAADHHYARYLSVTDSPDEVVAAIVSYDEETSRRSTTTRPGG
jgi:predicted Rossmann-fold nucleotide-binding protein